MYAPVSVDFVIFNTNPFWIAILAYMLNGEKMLRVEVIGVILCFLGICVLSFSSVTTVDSTQLDGEGSEVIGMACMLVASLLFSMVSISTRRLKDVHYTVISMFHGTIGMTAAMIIIVVRSLIFGYPFTLMSYPMGTVLKALMGGICDTSTIFFFTIGFQSDSSGFVSMFGYL